MAFNTRALFAVTALISIASTGSSIVSGTSKTTTSKATTSKTTSTAPKPTVYPHFDLQEQNFIPFSGFGGDDSVAWGVLAINESAATIDYPDAFLYEIVVNNSISPQSPFTTRCDEEALLILFDAEVNETYPEENFTQSLLMKRSNDGTLVLGPNSTLQLSGQLMPTSNCEDIDEIETLPFAINLGRNGYWNGSVGFGTWYDANRIGSTSWHLVPESANGSSTFLQVGQQDALITITDDKNSVTLNATLDINVDTLILPAPILCVGTNVTISFAGATAAQSLSIVMQSDLLTSIDRCKTTGMLESVTLGRPFFQSAYTYVDEMGQMYLTAANLYNLSISPALFKADATLKVPTFPALSSTPTPTPTKKSAASQISIDGRLLVVLLAIWAVI